MTDSAEPRAPGALSTHDRYNEVPLVVPGVATAKPGGGGILIGLWLEYALI